MGFKFELIDPSNPFGGAKRFEGLTEAIQSAAWRFGLTRRSRSDQSWKRRAVHDVERCIDRVESLVLKWHTDWEKSDPDSYEQNEDPLLLLGASFIDFLMTRDEAGLPPLTVTVGTSEQFDEFQMLAAVALRQCDRAAEAILKRNARWLSFLIWDIHEVLDEMIAIESRTDALEGVSVNAQRAAFARHREHREMKLQVQQHYQANKSKYRSKDAAAESIAGVVVPMPFRTVREWLKGI